MTSASSGGNDDGMTDDSTGAPPTTADDPAEPGPGTWQSSQAQVEIDGATIPLTLFIPDASGPHPVVVLTHGFQLGPSDYASYGGHLASYDYVVVMPQMPGSLFSPETHVQLRAYLVGILDWIEAVGSDPSAALLGRADAAQIALAGHSMGGKISLLTASADARPKAIFGIDPVDAAGGPGQGPSPDYPSVTPELMPLVVAPVALVGETTNATGGLGGACAPEDDNFHQYFVHATAPALEVEFIGANHMSFLDNPNCPVACLACPAGTDDTTVTRQRTQGLMVAFLQTTLRGDESYAPWLTGEPMQAFVDAGLVTFATANGF